MATIFHYNIRENDKYGRYLVSSKNLDAGEIIFTDTPFVVGPKPDNLDQRYLAHHQALFFGGLSADHLQELDCAPLCLGCYCPVDGTVCSFCRWPICSEACEQSPQHAGECAVFSTAKVRFHPVDDWTASSPQLDCITPLRLLLAKEKYPERWQRELEVMETHTEARRQRATWEADQINVVNYLIDYCKLGNRFDKELVQKVCGILEVNSVEVPSLGGVSVRAIYPRLGIAAHSCIPNIVHTINQDDYQVLIRAAVPINAGCHLHLCYTYALSPTMVRREHLLESKFFNCDCPRCADPTEIGTHLSTFLCKKCNIGLMLSTDPLDKNALWLCSALNCGYEISSVVVRKKLDLVQTEIEHLDSLGNEPQAIELREKFIDMHKSVFHPRHYTILSVKHTLAQLYGIMGSANINNDLAMVMQKKAEYCKDVLQTLDVITPGDTRMRGMILYELHSALTFLAKKEYSKGSILLKTLKDQLQESIFCLREASRILMREDPHSPEGITGQIALQSMKELKASLEAK